MSLDSTSWIPDSRDWILGSLSVELGFRFAVLRGIPDSKAQDSGFHRQKFPRLRNPDLLSLTTELGPA